MGNSRKGWNTCVVAIALLLVAVGFQACRGGRSIAPGTFQPSSFSADEPVDKQTSFLGEERWRGSIAAREGDVGVFASLAFDPLGNPTISYHDSTRGELWFAKRVGLAWQLEFVDSQGPQGYIITPVYGTSLAYDQSVTPAVPMISYYSRWQNPHLKLARWTENGWIAGTVDGADGVGTFSSLAFDSAGNRFIGYYDQNNMNLKFAWWNGSSWQIQTVDDQGDVGSYVSLALDQDGNPAISYDDGTNHALKLARATWNDVTQQWDWQIETVPEFEVVAGYTSLAFRSQDDSPYPYISYTVEQIGGFALGMQSLDFSDQSIGTAASSYTTSLKFAYQDAQGWHVETVDGSSNVQWTSLAFDEDGDAAIGYYDAFRGDLKFAYNGAYNQFTGQFDWQYEDVDIAGDVGKWVSLAFDPYGKPGVAYYNQTNQDLRFAKRGISTGAWRKLAVDREGSTGLWTSLEVVNGYPAISYYDATNANLKYVRATNALGANWGTPVIVDSEGNVGEHTSLAVVNGNPAISYYDATNGDLKYVRANDANGDSWGTPVTVDSEEDVGQYSSLAVVNGKPAISYALDTYYGIRYVRANDANGDTWGTPVTPDGSLGAGAYSSLAVVNGKPAISYFKNFDVELKYVRAIDANGSSWGTPVTPDSAGYQGLFTSLAVVNGNPAISYYELENEDLKYVRATDANGDSWGTPVTPDSEEKVGLFTSLAVVNGTPAISYMDATSVDLKYVQSTDPDGATWGSPITVDEAIYAGYNWCTSLVVLTNGQPAISYYGGYEDLKFAYYYQY